MKPTGPRTATASMAPVARDPAAPFSKQIESIDISVLEKLLEIKADRVQYESYCDRAEQLKASVPEQVYRRVVDDYSRRLAALDDRAKPIEAQVWGEYQKLETLLNQLKLAYEDGRLQQAELEFRRAVGELNDSGLAERRAEPDRLLEQVGTELGVVEQVRARFAEAVGPDDNLKAAPLSGSTSGGGVAGVRDSNIRPEDACVNANTELEEAATNLIPFEAGAAIPIGIAVPSGPHQTDAAEEQTFILPLAALIEDGHGAPPLEHRLGVLNYLGRSEDSQIHVAATNISRRHAVIEVVDDVYLIKDLESQNGTFVNGDRIKERALVDGDRIQIGDVHLVFRSPWILRRADAR